MVMPPEKDLLLNILLLYTSATSGRLKKIHSVSCFSKNRCSLTRMSNRYRNVSCIKSGYKCACGLTLLCPPDPQLDIEWCSPGRLTLPKQCWTRLTLCYAGHYGFSRSWLVEVAEVERRWHYSSLYTRMW